MKRRFYLLLTIIILFTGVLSSFAQDPAQYGTPFSGVPHPLDANIYQMNMREYSPSRDIAGARAKLTRIRDLGINVLYLMPIYPIGVTNSSGSPYCISKLTHVASDLGTLDDLRDLVEDAHNLGMAVILDWVANQTSWDHPWVTQHPDWYVRDGNGDILSPCPTPSFCFTDVAYFDLSNSTAADAMIQAMRYWVFAANIDGFRFDFADDAPPTFWTDAVYNLRSITSHDLLLLAEGSNEGSSTGCPSCGQNEPGYHFDQGFDYIFGTNFYWNVMKKVWLSGEPVTNLDGVTAGEYYGAGPTQGVARFLSDHDDYANDGSPFSFMPGKASVMSAFAVITYHRGVPFIYNGLEAGNTNPLPFPWDSGTINWTEDLSVYAEMQSILDVRNQSVALRRGMPVSYIDPADTNPDVIAFTKSSGSETAVVLVNVRNASRNFSIPSGMAGAYNDAFTGESVTLISGSGITLSPYQYLVFTNANVTPAAVEDVSVSPTSISIAQGLQQALTASFSPSNATNQNVIWSTADSSIATVSSTGVVTAVNPGITTITVRTEDGDYAATCQVTVTEATKFTVYFYKPAVWGTDINIYYWNTEPEGAMPAVFWPGVSMNSIGNDLYSFTFTNVSSTNLIFNDGTNQTDDLAHGTTAWYKDGVWYNFDPGKTVVDRQSYAGSPHSIPGTIQAEDYDTGGEGVAYHDNDAPNNGGQYRTWESVDIQACSEGGYNVGWISAGEWLEYTVNVPSKGTYNVDARVASEVGGAFHIEFDGIDKSGNIFVPDTGGWQNWQTVSATGLSLDSGTQIMRVYMDGNDFNINRLSFTEGSTSVPVDEGSDSSVSSPLSYAGVIQIPGTVEAENYDNGGEGVAYHDNDASNNGGQYRAGEGVDIEACSEGGYNVGWINAGEWIEYIVNVSSPGTYDLDMRVASPGGSSVHVEFNGDNVTGLLTVPATGGWQVWQSIKTSVSLNSGQQIMRVYMDGGSFNINNIIFTSRESSTTYYAIQNRWTGVYLNDSGDNVGYGSSIANNNYIWEIQDINAAYALIVNMGTGDVIHIENLTGKVQCSSVDESFWSSQWTLEDVDGKYSRIRNRWKTNDIINIENQTGLAEYWNGQNGWWSAHWQFIPVNLK